MSTKSVNAAVCLAKSKDASLHASMQDINDQEGANTVQKDKELEGAAYADEDDAVSECATIVNGGEPFETFQHKVSEHASKIFHKKQSDITIKKMKGGTYNRVVGVTISSKVQKFTLEWFKSCLRRLQGIASVDSKSYIIRIPRVKVTGENAVRSMRDDMEQEVAILKTVQSQLPLPTPQVVSYDLTTDNVFERPYMVQKRIPGKNLQIQLWDQLNLEQKKSVVKQVANLPSIIASLQGPAGNLSCDNLSRTSVLSVITNKFHKPAYDKQSTPRLATTHKPLEFLLECINHWRAYQTAKQGFCFEELWDAFEIIANSLEKHGFLNGPCVLVQRDLKPYNLLAEIRSDTEVEITGVIDCDSAVIAPEFMAYPAPFWSWLPDDAADRTTADEEVFCLSAKPCTEDGKAIKQTFEENVSEKYKMYSFSMQAILARRMFLVLHDGIFGPWMMSETQNIIVHYIELHPEDGVEYEDASEDEVAKAQIAISQYKVNNQN